MRRPAHSTRKRRQQGIALMLMLTIMILGVTAVLIGSLGTTALKNLRQEKTAEALSQAKDALIGYAITYGDTHASAYGYLPCPDTNNDGSADANQGSTNCAGNNIPVIGRLPWKSLGLPPLRDGHGECLWYAVSGTFKAVAGGQINDEMDWDTPGQFEIRDANGATLAGATPYNRAVAVIFSAGPPLNTQDHPLGSGQECSGNASNDVTAYMEEGNAFIPPASPPASPIVLTAGKPGSTTNNDTALWITAGDIYDRIKKRSDFSPRISALMNDAYFQTILVSGAKGTGSVICGNLDAANQQFCANWLNMLLLTELGTPAPIAIDGTPTAGDCARVLIFGGQRTDAQSRQNDADKSLPANYIENQNAAAFASPVSASGNFSGNSAFDKDNPGTDLLRCLP